MENYVVEIDGQTWRPSNRDTAQYDAIHAAAGAVLAGADNVEIRKIEQDESYNGGVGR